MAIGYIIFLSISSVAFGAFQLITKSKKERYANIQEKIHGVQHHIRNASEFLNQRSPEAGSAPEDYEIFLSDFRRTLIPILDTLRSIFEMLTGTECRSSIKLFYKTDLDDLCYYTLVRDRMSQDRYSELDLARRKKNHDQLSKNSEFSKIYDSNIKRWHFFCNDISKLRDFRFTSRSAYNEFTDSAYEPSWLERLSRNSSDRLPFRSTVTCAIRLPAQREWEIGEPFDHVIGFLTIDSQSRNVFTEKWDVHVLFSAADSLYQLLLGYHAVEYQALSAGLSKELSDTHKQMVATDAMAKVVPSNNGKSNEQSPDVR